MVDTREVSLMIQGLPVDNGNVRAEIFLEKFRHLIHSLKLADAHLNGRKSHNLVIVHLAIGSALARVREKVSVKKRAPQSSALVVGDAMRSIYNGDKGLERFPVELIESLAPLPKGIEKKFSYAEIEFDADNVIRIDDYFARQMERAINRVRGLPEEEEASFEGLAFGTFDGILKEMDSRGVLVRGKLILTAGGKEIDCIFRREDIPQLRKNFEKRARIKAVAHYDGEQLLPVRLDVREIEAVSDSPDLARWRGVLAGRRVFKRGGL